MMFVFVVVFCSRIGVNMMQMLLLFTLCALEVFADKHSLVYLYTGLTPNYTGFPEFTAVGLLDGRQFMFYNSSNMKLILEQWIKKSNKEEYWTNEEEDMQGDQHDFNDTFTTIKNQFNHSTGVHTLQRMYGCEINDDNTTRGYDQYGYNGEDFISLDLNTGTWIIFKPQALILKQKWESTRYTQYWKNFLEHNCTDLLNEFVNYNRETLERKVPPSASVMEGGGVIGIVIGVVVALVVVVVVVVAGILVWKKKKCGFTRVPPSQGAVRDDDDDEREIMNTNTQSSEYILQVDDSCV